MCNLRAHLAKKETAQLSATYESGYVSAELDVERFFRKEGSFCRSGDLRGSARLHAAASWTPILAYFHGLRAATPET